MEGLRSRLAGKVAVLSGGSRGIGLAIARELLSRGARVLLTARGRDGLDEAAARLEETAAGAVRVAQAHSAREAEVAAAFQAAVDAFGSVDIVVNNAATNPSMAPLADMEMEVFDKILATNLRGYLLMAREGVRRMRAAGKGGAIINISTVGAYRAMKGLGAYGISKAGVDAMTRSLAAELAPEGIRVNGVAPGLVRTRFSEALWKDPEMERRMVRSIPLGRLAEPEDIAGAVAFLASDEARYITGQTLVADGGMLAV
jgi:NAD(P)-dependent dehydrogenase (short-subunit alcohol dehydrogenase family)